MSGELGGDAHGDPPHGAGTAHDAGTEHDALALWQACEGHIKGQVSDSNWTAWFARLRPEGLVEGELVIATSSTFIMRRLEERFSAVIHDALDDVGAADLAVRFVVRPELDVPKQLEFGADTPEEQDGRDEQGVHIVQLAEQVEQAEADRRQKNRGWRDPKNELSTGSSTPGHNTPGTRNGAATNRKSDKSGQPSGQKPDDHADFGVLNDRYTFEQFVTGESNRFAHAACMAVAENPARSYNPLFIYGDAGLGKTHLIQAIGNYVRVNFPLKHVRYISTETFLSDFVDSIRTGSQGAFKKRYRDCDVLLVDDIQSLEGAKETQNEFFHTFNHLYGLNSQIVITSDRHPSSLETLEERLRTRFLAGLLTDVQPPELETRMAILRRKAEDVRVHCPDEVLDLIASNVKHNIRELEGALTRVTAYASLQQVALTKSLAEDLLRDLLSATPREPTMGEIINAVAVEFSIDIEELTGPSRRKNLVDARQIAMYLCRSLTQESYPSIARTFGGRDHSTVIYAVDKITKLMGDRPVYFAKVNGLTQKLRQDHR